jgi:hypothetical protein
LRGTARTISISTSCRWPVTPRASNAADDLHPAVAGRTNDAFAAAGDDLAAPGSSHQQSPSTELPTCATMKCEERDWPRVVADGRWLQSRTGAGTDTRRIYLVLTDGEKRQHFLRKTPLAIIRSFSTGETRILSPSGSPPARSFCCLSTRARSPAVNRSP